MHLLGGAHKDWHHRREHQGYLSWPASPHSQTGVVDRLIVQDYFYIIISVPPSLFFGCATRLSVHVMMQVGCSAACLGHQNMCRKEWEVRCLVHFWRGIRHQTYLCGLDPVVVFKARGDMIVIGTWMKEGHREALEIECPWAWQHRWWGSWLQNSGVIWWVNHPSSRAVLVLFSGLFWPIRVA